MDLRKQKGRSKKCVIMQTILKEKQEMKELVKESTKAKKIERKEKNIEYVRKLMERLQMSFKEAVSLLEIPEKEIKEIEKYFQS